MNRFLQTLMIKLSGAGFTMGIVALFFSMSTGFDLFELQEVASTGFIWITVYGYGILTSFIIERIASRFQKIRIVGKVFLYIAASYLYFLLLFAIFSTSQADYIVIVLFAGTVGAGFAMLFLIGTVFAQKSFRFQIITAFLIPISFIILLLSDVTEKRGWKEEFQEARYIAEFDHFNGEHSVPVTVKKGEVLKFTMNWNIQSGGYGYRVEKKNGDVGGVTHTEDWSFNIAEEGAYYIVISGDDASGKVEIVWGKSN